MTDPRFFPPAGPFPLSRLAEISGASLPGRADSGRPASGVAPLEDATPGDVSFLHNAAYLPQLSATKAGCCVVGPAFADRAPPGADLLISDNPYLAYARIAAAFHPDPDRDYLPEDPSRAIHPEAEIGEDAVIGAGAVVGPGARIGRRCRIGPSAYVGREVRIGDDCRIGPSASARCALIGNDVTLHAGARVGEPGFGFAFGPEGPVSVPQVGRVVIGDRVEIGANSTVDRGSGPDTIVGAGTRIDNLVQIGHNVRIGRRCVVAGMVGIAGSARIGDGVMLGGQAGVAGHVSVGDEARIASQSGIIRDVAPGATVMGLPAVPIRRFFRHFVALSRLAERSREGDGRR